MTTCYTSTRRFPSTLTRSNGATARATDEKQPARTTRDSSDSRLARLPCHTTDTGCGRPHVSHSHFSYSLGHLAGQSGWHSYLGAALDREHWFIQFTGHVSDVTSLVTVTRQPLMLSLHSAYTAYSVSVFFPPNNKSHPESERETMWGVTFPVAALGPQQRRPFRPDRGYRCAADIQNPSFSLGQTWRNDSKIPVIKRTLVLYE